MDKRTKIKYWYYTSELNQVKQHNIKLMQILNHIDQLILGWCVGLWETRFSIPYYTQLINDHQMQKKFEKNVGSSIIFFNFDLHNFLKLKCFYLFFVYSQQKNENIFFEFGELIRRRKNIFAFFSLFFSFVCYCLPSFFFVLLASVRLAFLILFCTFFKF